MACKSTDPGLSYCPHVSFAGLMFSNFSIYEAGACTKSLFALWVAWYAKYINIGDSGLSFAWSMIHSDAFLEYNSVEYIPPVLYTGLSSPGFSPNPSPLRASLDQFDFRRRRSNNGSSNQSIPSKNHKILKILD